MRRFQTFTILLLSNVPFINPFTRSFDLLTSFKDKYRPIDLSKERTNERTNSCFHTVHFLLIFFLSCLSLSLAFCSFFTYTRRKEGEKKEGGQIRTYYVTIFATEWFYLLCFFVLFFFSYLRNVQKKEKKKETKASTRAENISSELILSVKIFANSGNK